MGEMVMLSLLMGLCFLLDGHLGMSVWARIETCLSFKKLSSCFPKRWFHTLPHPDSAREYQFLHFLPRLSTMSSFILAIVVSHCLCFGFGFWYQGSDSWPRTGQAGACASELNPSLAVVLINVCWSLFPTHCGLNLGLMRVRWAPPPAHSPPLIVVCFLLQN